MFKFAAKLTLLSLLFTVAFMSIGSGEVSAQACTFGTDDDKFGVRETGEHSGGMGGIKVKARYDHGGPINVSYKLKSDVPGNHPAKTSEGADYDQRIFKWPIGSGRTDSKVFSTGENLYPGPFQCDGKSVLGPGEPDARGNRWVLDCVENGRFVDFWIDEIGTPNGEKGRWTVVVEGNENEYMKQPFQIRNGDNVRVDLIFHPEEPVGNIQSVECERVRLVGYYRSNPSKPVKFKLVRGSDDIVIHNKSANNQTRWYSARSLAYDFDRAWPNKITLRLFINTGKKWEKVGDTWRGAKTCDRGETDTKCTRIRFKIQNDSKGLPGNSPPNTPEGRSHYAIYVNDYGTPGHPAFSDDSPDYRPNDPDSVPAGSGKYNLEQAPNHWEDGRWVDYSGEAAQGSIVDKNLRLDNKIVSGRLVWTVVVYDWFWNGTRWRIQVQHRETNSVENCFKASCDIDIKGNVPGREGSDAVKAGSTLEGTLTIRNEGRNRLLSWIVTNHGSYGLSLTGPPEHYIHEGISPGEEVTKPIEDFFDKADIKAPNNIGNHKLELYPDYFGRFKIGPTCSEDYRTFKEFNLSPRANSITFEDDSEDPSAVVFNSSISNTVDERPATVNIPVTRAITKNDNSYDSWTSSPSLGSATFNDSSGISEAVLGDRYCGRISVSPAHGWQGPGGDREIRVNDRSDGTCDNIVNRPYLRAYGADVTAGSNFSDGQTCNPADSGQIRTYTSGRDNKSGSGAQLAAIAINIIDDFTSASLRTSTPTAPHGLSFGNEDSLPGNYAGSPICSTDFYGETQSENPDNKRTIYSSNYNANRNESEAQVLINRDGGDVTINGSNFYNKEKVIYVDGDAKITSNIAYVPFTDPTDAPSLAIVVLGDLYVQSNVTRLDGLYVAQAREDGSGGNIYTCASNSGFDDYNNDQIFNNCGGPEGEGGGASKQLTVNGAFVAHNIHFHRFHKSLRASNANPDELAGNTQASEIFQYSPELYLSPPPFALDASSTTEFPYYTTLPPIL